LALLKRASALGHPRARQCLGLGKRVQIHSLSEGDAEILDAPRSPHGGNRSSALSSRLATTTMGLSSPRRGPSSFVLDGAEGVATAFDDQSNRFVVHLTDGLRVRVKAANLRMER